MGYACGVRWDEKKLGRMRELCLCGYRVPDIATVLSVEFRETITISAVNQAKYKNPLTEHSIAVETEGVKFYESDTLPDDNYMVSCDYHCPYHSEPFVNRLLGMADKFGITKHIIVGDLFDMDFAKFWASDDKMDMEGEKKHTDPVLAALSYFDLNYLVHGNHENRINRLADSKIQFKHLMTLYGNTKWAESFRYTPYDKVFIGDEWMLVHPHSYSQISPQVARRLAEKYRRHIINTHGHLVGSGTDRSGTNMAVDLGGMFERRKISYINKKTTSHPVWGNGFGMLRDGKFWTFDQFTDWKYWGLV